MGPINVEFGLASRPHEIPFDNRGYQGPRTATTRGPWYGAKGVGGRRAGIWHALPRGGMGFRAGGIPTVGPAWRQRQLILIFTTQVCHLYFRREFFSTPLKFDTTLDKIIIAATQYAIIFHSNS